MIHAYQDRKPRNWPSFTGNANERASQALSRLEDITRLVSDIVWEMDKDGVLTFVSERTLETLDLPPQHLIGKRLEDLGEFLSAKGVPDWSQPCRDLLFKIKSPKGDERTFLISALPHFNKTTWDFEGVYGTAKDITESLAAERSLRMLSEIIEQYPSMVFVTELDGTIQYTNAMFTHMTGYTAEEATGQKPNLLQSGETSDETYRDMWSTILSGSRWHGEIQNKRKNGSIFWASLTINPIALNGDEINHFVAVHEDITDRKAAEEKLTAAKEQAEIASRTKSEILANTSHELRTPLNAIIGFSSAIQNQTFGPLNNASYEKYIDIIKESGEHLLDLINDILDIASLEASQISISESTFRLADVIKSSAQLVIPQAQQNRIDLVHDAVDQCAFLYADERRIKQIVLNLLSNAVKFTPYGGRVEITTAWHREGDLLIIVTDTGIGMSESDIVKAMTQFGQVESDHTRRFQGTGLGLPLTQGLVELHGGSMKIISEKGAGTTVQVRLPQNRVATPG